MEALRYRVVFHLDEDLDERIKLTLANIKNVVDEMGVLNIEIILVIIGKALNAFQRDSRHAEKVRDLKRGGISFLACRKSLSWYGMNETDILDQFTFTNSGVAELIKRQNEGWAYIRP